MENKVKFDVSAKRVTTSTFNEAFPFQYSSRNELNEQVNTSLILIHILEISNVLYFNF